MLNCDRGKLLARDLYFKNTIDEYNLTYDLSRKLLITDIVAVEIFFKHSENRLF